MTMEIVERVALAIKDTFDRKIMPTEWVSLQPHFAQQLARAAIEAMMEPTEAMRRAAIDTDFITWISPPSAYSLDMGKAFNAMLRKALED